MSRTRNWIAITLAGLLSACGGGREEAGTAGERRQVLAATAEPVFTVVRLNKVSETRVGRSAYEYAFAVTFRNAGAARTNITATLTAVGPGTVIVDGSVVISTVGAGLETTPADTITVRHDRSVPFAVAALAWTFTDPINGVAVPAPPDPATNGASIGGTDTNRNGIRDDVERLVAQEFGIDAARFERATLVARTLQSSVVAPSPAAIKAHIDSIRCIQSQGELTGLFPLEALTLNTVARRKAYANAFAGVYTSFEGC